MLSGTAILLIESESDEVERVVSAIRQAEVAVRIEVARDGREALRLLGLAPEGSVAVLWPRVVLLALRSPRIDALEVLRCLRAGRATSRLPVVVISDSTPAADDVRRSYALGANSFVVMRSDAGGPAQRLGEVARYWTQQNQPLPRRGPIR